MGVYVIMPYFDWTDAARIGWIVGYVCAAALGVVLYWFCPRFSVAMTSCWLMYLAGIQLNLVILNYYPNLQSWVGLIIVISAAVAGFFLGCLFPNFMIMIGT